MSPVTQYIFNGKSWQDEDGPDVTVVKSSHKSGATTDVIPDVFSD